MHAHTIRFISRPVGRSLDANIARDEPSHIHIARPSRLLCRDSNAGSSIEPADQLRELAATDVTVARRSAPA